MTFNQENNIVRQYEIISTALDTGQRFIYDREEKHFTNVTWRQAHKLDTNRYITDLPGLQTQLKSVIEQYGIDDNHKQRLIQAFEERADDLEHRFILYGRKARDAGVQHLRECKSIIETAASQHTSRFAGAI